MYRQLLKNCLVFILAIALLSVCFATMGDLDNRTAKLFRFYPVIAAVSIFCIFAAWRYRFRFTLTDGAIILFTIYSLFNYYYLNSPAITKLELIILLAVVYFLFRLIWSFNPEAQVVMSAALILTGAIEAVWGLLQLYGITHSFHHLSHATGSFFNPGPYGGFLAAIAPLALHYTLVYRTGNSTVFYKIRFGFYLLCTFLILCIIPATMSRAAWIAAFAGCGIIVVNHFRILQHITRFYKDHRKWFYSATASLSLFLILLFSCVYLMKKDSADGRVVLWKVTTDIIARHPFLGVGTGMFGGAYGEAQGDYFATHRTTNQEQLVADAPEFGFNEYLQISAETGLTGLLLFGTIVFSAFIPAIRKAYSKKSGIIASLLAFLLFAFFSYPFSMLPLCIVFVLLLALCQPGDTTSHTPVWLNICFYLILCGITLSITWSKPEKRKAYITWKREQTYFRMNIYKGTVDHYRELYPSLKDQFDFLFEYGQCLSKTEQYAESNRILYEAARLSSDPMIRNIIGKNHQALQQYESAESCFRQAHNMVPNRIYPLYLLAKLYIESGQTEKAVETARLVIDKIPKVPSAAINEMKQEMKEFLQNIHQGT